MQCPECGEPLDDDANFCMHCGSDLRDDTAVGDQNDEPTDPGIAGAPTTVVPVPIPAASELTNCRNCGAPNSPTRVLCGRCGADLATGQLRSAPRVPARDVPADGTMALPVAAPADRTRESRTGVIVTLVLVVGLVVGGGLGAAVAFNFGPFADDDGLPEVTFDALVYRGSTVNLSVASALASTVLPAEGEFRYDADLMFDGDLTTAWNSNGDDTHFPSGIGATVTIRLSQPAWVTEFVVANGYQKGGPRFAENGRVQQALIRLDGGQTFKVTLLDREGRQSVQLAAPVLTTTVKIEVLQVFEGDRYPDLAISEFLVKGHVAVGQDVDLAEQRAAALS